MATKAKKSKATAWQRAKTLVATRFPRFYRGLRIFIYCLAVGFLLDTGYLIGIWPDWEYLAKGPIPKSAFIKTYERSRLDEPELPRLRWQPVAIENVPRHLLKALLTAEDARFYEHSGIDTEAFKQAMEYNWERKRFVLGGSTLSQQTAKNLFLNPSRNPLRKWNEIVLTWAMEYHLSKKRILELYINEAEFGVGLYGVEAAAQHYWGIRAADLTAEQAIELAATLPAPKNHNPQTRSRFFIQHRAQIMRNMGYALPGDR